MSSPKTGKLTRIRRNQVVIPPWNPRTDMDAKGKKFLQASFDTFGNAELMVFNRTTGHLIAGAKRFEFLADQEEFDVWEVALTVEQEKMASLALNNHVGNFDEAGVKLLLSQTAVLPDSDKLMQSMGVSAAEIAAILNPPSAAQEALNRTNPDERTLSFMIDDLEQFKQFRTKVNTLWASNALPGEQAGDTILRLLRPAA